MQGNCNISDFIDLPTDTRHKITISANIKNGKIKTSHVKAHKGTLIEVVDTPDEYFELEYYTVNGKQQDYRQFEMPNEDVLIVENGVIKSVGVGTAGISVKAKNVDIDATASNIGIIIDIKYTADRCIFTCIKVYTYLSVCITYTFKFFGSFRIIFV